MGRGPVEWRMVAGRSLFRRNEAALAPPWRDRPLLAELWPWHAAFWYFSKPTAGLAGKRAEGETSERGSTSVFLCAVCG